MRNSTPSGLRAGPERQWMSSPPIKKEMTRELAHFHAQKYLNPLTLTVPSVLTQLVVSASLSQTNLVSACPTIRFQ